MNQKIITIDGPSGAGKSTVSRIAAKRLGLLYLDTGAMYRAVALQAHRKGISFQDGDALKTMCKNIDIRFDSRGDTPKIFLGEEDISLAIRSPEMDMLASSVSVVKEVRKAMTELQRKIGHTESLIAEGRDMGTVVFPESAYKFFITASTNIRAERRYNERIERGEKVSIKDVEEELIKRDEKDKKRTIAPLRPAEDAVIIDTTDLDIYQVVDKITNTVKGEQD